MSDARVDGAVSRRRVVQGALWAAPAIVIATAVPAAATSPTPAGVTITAVPDPVTRKAKIVTYTVTVSVAGSGSGIDAGFTLVVTHPNTGPSAPTFNIAGTNWTSGTSTATSNQALTPGNSTVLTATLTFPANNTHLAATFTVFDTMPGGTTLATITA